jgi:hypothetical protein
MAELVALFVFGLGVLDEEHARAKPEPPRLELHLLDDMRVLTQS